MHVTVILAILCLLLAAVLSLRLRVRFQLDEKRRLLFVGLGRSGPEFDFVHRFWSFKLFGVTVKTSAMKKAAEPAAVTPGEPPHKKKKPTTKKPGRLRPWREIVAVVPKCASVVQRYSIDLLKSVIVEQLEAEIEAGFEQPDMTGRLFGYYQAALAAAPAVVGHVRYIPDWTGASFTGRARVAVALPLYRLVYRTLVLIVRLPLRRLIKLAIGRKRGGQDG